MRVSPSRRHARWEVQYAYTRRSDQSSLLDDQSWQRPIAIDVETREERAWEEYDMLGFTLTVDHPLDLMHEALDMPHIVVAEQLRHHVGQVVDVAGVIVAGRRIHTSGDKLMVFASLCDQSGTMELTLFSDAAEQYSEQVSEGGMVIVRGHVTSNFERGIGIEVQSLRQLEA